MPPSIPTCDRCRQPAITFLRYCGMHLCRRHLPRFVRQRVRAEVRRQGGIPGDASIIVGTSGGKDSTVALRLVHELVRDRPDVRLTAVTVDEGIPGYRPPGIQAAARAAAELGVEHIVRATRDQAGMGVSQIAELPIPRAPCSYCGVFRRQILNDVATEVGATLVVTGHNLDDVAQSVLMNVAAGDIDRLGRMGPHGQSKPGMVPRRMPLRSIPEQEVYLMAMVEGWDFDDGTCPHAPAGLRGVHRDVLNQLEDARPGTRHALVKTLDRVRPLVQGQDAPPLGVCDACGRPSSGDVCQACRLRDELAALAARKA